MHMKIKLFGRGNREARQRSDRPRYVSSIQRDVQKYEGWRDVDVDADYRASKSVHTIVTLGYLEYHEGTLVLTDKGRMLMQNVAPVQAVPTD